ncbi:MAG: bifunctional acetate--CoA ligase family protein/GNAT family N-acetyltransferase, partial [Jatrophihabitans sp.]|uniref:bifunctional acetate--CoA ligase family protein/GNAT family N-acetyltransferase n=1 Tax=Jatrophihabitans sp. TaxID=1932789 RepID=UPI003F7F2F3D
MTEPTDEVLDPDEFPDVDPEPPAHWSADVVVADGGVVRLRPIRPADADALVRFHAGLSARTRYLRYFSAYPRIPERDLYKFTHMDHHDRVGIVAVLGDEIIAVGRYERITPPGTTPVEAEVAFVVADDHQGRGIGSILLEHLAAAGRESGIERFQAIVLAENGAMMRVFRDAGYEVARHLEFGEVTLEFGIDATAVTEAVAQERERHAEGRSIQRLLHPRSVAMVGASNDDTKIAHAVFQNLLRAGFQGPLYPVNERERHVSGVPAFASIGDIPGSVDLAVLAIPADRVDDVVRQCGEAGVRGIVVVSGGFGERGDDDERAAGHDRQVALLDEARRNGMRLVGPNCLGIVNTDPTVSLNASLAPVAPLRGRAGFFCQSGTLGIVVLNEAARRGLGMSTFVSAGNRADVSGNDLLQYWETDDSTDVVLMYLESFGNPRKFARLARRVGRTKPIIALNSGAGVVVPGLAATTTELPPQVVRALFDRTGVIRVDVVGDLFDIALLLTSQPLPKGDRVAVVGNSAALGVLVANACAAEGLTAAWSRDLGNDAPPELYEQALQEALDDDDVDAVIVIFAPALPPASGERVAEVVRRLAPQGGKPIVSTFLGIQGVPEALAAPGDTHPAPGSVPSFLSPERAVRALARAARYAAWRRRPISPVPTPAGIDRAAARALVEGVLAATPDGRELDAGEVSGLLAAYGLDLSSEVPVDAVGVRIALQEHGAFGSLLAFGLAGVATELLDDRAYAIVPLTEA